MGHCTLHQHFSAIEKELDLLKKTTKGEFSSSLFTDLQTEVKIQGEELHKEVKMATEAIEDSTKSYIGEINLQITGLKQQVADLSTQTLNLEAKYSEELRNFGQQLQDFRQQLVHEQDSQNNQFLLALSGNETMPREAEESLLNLPPIPSNLEVNVIDFGNLMKFYSGEGDESFSEFILKFEDFANQQSTPWDDKTKLSKLRLLLSGEAREKFQITCGDSDSLTYAQAKQKLLASYKQDSLHSGVLSELHATRQRDGETVDDFFCRLRRVLTKLMPDASPEELKTRFKEEFTYRLLDSISTPLQWLAPTTLEEARQKARTIESSLRRSEVQRTEMALRQLGSGVNAALAQNWPTNQGASRPSGGQLFPSQTNNYPVSPYQNIRCFFCQSLGHVKRECRKFAAYIARQNSGPQQSSNRPNGGTPWQRNNYGQPRNAQYTQMMNNNQRSGQRQMFVPSSALPPRHTHANAVQPLLESPLFTDDIPLQQPTEIVQTDARDAALQLLQRKRDQRMCRHVGHHLLVVQWANNHNTTKSSNWQENNRPQTLNNLNTPLLSPKLTPSVALFIALHLITLISGTEINPMICQNSNARTLYKIPSMENCDLPPLEIPVPMTLEIFKPNTDARSQAAWSCRIQKATIQYSTSLTGLVMETPVTTETMLVHPRQCWDMLKTKNCAFGSLTNRSTLWLTNNNFKRDYPWPVLGSFSWKTEHVHNCEVLPLQLQFAFGDNTVQSPLGTFDNCPYSQGYCTTPDHITLIWTPKASSNCPFIKVSTTKGLVSSRLWMASNNNMALEISPDQVDNCGTFLNLTSQGFAVTTHETRPKRAKLVDAELLSSVASALSIQSVLMIKSSLHFAQMERCRQQRQITALQQAIMEQDATSLARSILNFPYVHARRVTPSILEVLQCTPVPFSTIKIRESKFCYELTPIYFIDSNLKVVSAFLDTVDMIIKHDSHTIPCLGARGAFPLGNNSWVQFLQPYRNSTFPFPQNITLLHAQSEHNNSAPPNLAINIFRVESITNFSAPTPLLSFTPPGARFRSQDLSHELPEGPQTVLSLLTIPQWLIQSWIYGCCCVVSLQLIFIVWAFSKFLKEKISPAPKPVVQVVVPQEKPTVWPPPLVASCDNGIPYAQIPLKINGVPLCGLIDTGASMSIMAAALAPALGLNIAQHAQRFATSASGHTLRLFDDKVVTLEIGNLVQNINMTFSDNTNFLNASYDVIIGCTALAELPPMLIDMKARTVAIGRNILPLMSPEEMAMLPVKIKAISAVTLHPFSTTLVQCHPDTVSSPSNTILMINDPRYVVDLPNPYLCEDDKSKLKSLIKAFRYHSLSSI
ncbi:unnamed protein product [Bursaphelenchus xylophilus]|uniref:(pine wood nematode) hypothetical protein n=1 Tax=Bursaphelenchus xylophilus TaxID=6326 RepID=A0A7I8WFW7_BURXY|nr:unnamed protein product [Bursaphelenchus xylophilus]CAG9111808.1 unnamed protein product [Bursaphelenchus xylophilus]